ncbi:unnamed protein product [Spirodela intermedia]|uniref:Uncharacterized protein n=1 Tax=Spirodela intermedia TaxID=51605 RepID=A0A7I8KZ83_SPIIN|nr:unnamed protein product [Spirodela intermedia]
MNRSFLGKRTYQAISSSSPDLTARRSASSPAKFTSVHEGDRYWLGRLDHKDWLAPNEVLKIFRGLTNPDLLVDAFRKISSRKDYKPSEALYSLLISRLSHARKFGIIEDLLPMIKSERCRVSEEFFFQLIKIYGNVANHPEQAIKTLMMMPDFHCWPTVRTFNYVLNMLVNAKQFDVIHEVYLNAPKLGVELDTCCFNILIKGLCSCGNLAAAFSLFEEMPNQGCKPNARTYSTLMHSLCRNERVSDAFDLYRRMEADGCYPDTVTFNILISGLCREGKVIQGMEFLKKMKLKGCYPNSGTYQALLYGFIDAGRFVEGKEFMGLMLADGYCPSYLSYKTLIEGLCRGSFIAEAEEVLKQMVRHGFVPRMGTWREILQCLLLRTEAPDSFDVLIRDLDR